MIHKKHFFLAMISIGLLHLLILFILDTFQAYQFSAFQKEFSFVTSIKDLNILSDTLIDASKENPRIIMQENNQWIPENSERSKKYSIMYYRQILPSIECGTNALLQEEERKTKEFHTWPRTDNSIHKILCEGFVGELTTSSRLFGFFGSRLSFILTGMIALFAGLALFYYGKYVKKKDVQALGISLWIVLMSVIMLAMLFMVAMSLMFLFLWNGPV